ncbi:ATP-binding protein [Tumidithrix helvetica PCC 7403]|uniref:slr1658 superfamily regulator n=1 Tax=Tumidithrix helvetica TaxID=3457545 RepID=UPI003CAEFE52
MVKVFGDFLENLPKQTEFLVLGFSPSSLPIQKRWRNNGLSADFLADYMTTFFPGEPTSTKGISKQSEIKGVVSYIANELLENAMKYSDDNVEQPISLSLYLFNDKLIFLSANCVVLSMLDRFQAFLTELTTHDPYELYIQKVESIAEEDNQSGLGYLTLINDYGASLGWKFQEIQSEPKIVTVTTMVQLPL